MKKDYRDPELEIELFDGVVDCLTISDGDHEDQGSESGKDLDT